VPTRAKDAERPVGLLAGSGRFPIAFAEKAREVGLPVVCVGLGGIAPPELRPLVHRFHWSGALQMGRMIRLFKREGVRRLVMAGKVPKADLMHNPWNMLTLLPDLRTIRLYYFSPRRDNRDDALLLAVVDEFAGEGLTFESALTLCPELLVKPGILTRRAPTAREEADIAFGWTMAREMGRLDVGQSVAVKDRAVLSIEAIEGTDKAILRAGELCRSGGFTVIKVAKPNQDMRFDVPVVGVKTIETMQKSGATCLALNAGKCLFLDGDSVISAADGAQICIIAE
jgi:UDP-2,3-diacylglucosamine hydrolase